ncbi:hypothetical protein [Halobaculum lipolyticum]|uniref:Uncharacterized protein n=1 Tax=Halobaculum lipolyticum TaxID=3032001 RepID=A0ABD5WC75_9EURY|nr:hypothetical protein [Halobaculum sp. DT31]
MSDETLWWGQPLDARRYHIFEGEGAPESLCGGWLLPYDGHDPEVSEGDTFTDGQDCKECARKAGVLDE